MVVTGDLAEPGKVDTALYILQTPLDLRLWPFRPAGLRAGKQVRVPQQSLDTSLEYAPGLGCFLRLLWELTLLHYSRVTQTASLVPRSPCSQPSLKVKLSSKDSLWFQIRPGCGSH